MWCSRTVNLLLLLIFCVWGSSGSGDMRPSVVNVKVAEGFLIRLLGDTGRVPLQNCQLTRNNKLYFLAPGQNNTYTLSTGELVQPFDYNNTYECGVRVFGVGVLSKGQWKLSSVDEQGKERSGSAEVQITREIGCPIDKEKDCRLLSLDNEFLGLCNKIMVDTVNYKCDFFADGQISRQSVAHLAGKKEMPSPYLKTQTGSTVLDCRHTISAEEKVTACHIEHVPTKTKYFIQEGLLDKRFSTYKTDFGSGICQFEFLGEISEDQIGTWILSLEIMTTQNNPRYDRYYNNGYDRFIYTNKTKTCKFQLKGNETLALEKIALRTNSTEVIKTLENTTTLECAKNIFYPLRVCYLLTQEGEILFSNDYVSFADGNCKFEVHFGNWTCGFNGPKEEDQDFVQNFEVIQYEKEIIDEEAKVAEDGSVSIECHLISRNQVKVCMLVSPSGIVFRPPTDQFKSEEFSYYGGGSFNTGDCGITFGKDAEVESGNWKCLIVKMNDEKLSSGIFVPEEVDNSQ